MQTHNHNNITSTKHTYKSMHSFRAWRHLDSVCSLVCTSTGQILTTTYGVGQHTSTLHAIHCSTHTLDSNVPLKVAEWIAVGRSVRDMEWVICDIGPQDMGYSCFLHQQQNYNEQTNTCIVYPRWQITNMHNTVNLEILCCDTFVWSFVLNNFRWNDPVPH